MKKSIRLIIALAVPASVLLIAGCSTDPVQDTRHSGLERRQDRIDSRTSARQARWQERGEREDARAKARFDSW
jgi:outer membrane murein-binding lipoprotein Lpp